MLVEGTISANGNVGTPDADGFVPTALQAGSVLVEFDTKPSELTQILVKLPEETDTPAAVIITVTVTDISGTSISEVR